MFKQASKHIQNCVGTRTSAYLISGRMRGGTSLGKKGCSSGLVYLRTLPCICSVSQSMCSSRLNGRPSVLVPAPTSTPISALILSTTATARSASCPLNQHIRAGERYSCKCTIVPSHPLIDPQLCPLPQVCHNNENSTMSSLGCCTPA